MLKEQFKKNKLGWKKSFIEGFSQDENGAALPWMTYPAIEFLKKNLTKNHQVFEFGCGASTLFFAERVKEVVGLETDARWAEIIFATVGVDPRVDPLTNSKSIFISGGHAGPPLQNVKINLMPDGLTNISYENFPKNSGKKFDFIIIDSLKRFECAKNAIDALKPDGRIILDDSERKNYKKIFDFFAEKNFTKQDFFGIAPGQIRIKNTTIFYR